MHSKYFKKADEQNGKGQATGGQNLSLPLYLVIKKKITNCVYSTTELIV